VDFCILVSIFGPIRGTHDSHTPRPRLSVAGFSAVVFCDMGTQADPLSLSYLWDYLWRLPVR